MAENSRKFERVGSRLRCWCESDGVTFYARVSDLSEGGLFLRTSTPLRTGARARLRFTISDQSLIETEATVVWARSPGEAGPAGMGLRFDSVDEKTRETIRRAVLGEKRDP